ncbi:MAG: HAMP domain-containing histidine kinase [Bacteroidales bacterium]|nr:HAMP domain-containing histidine kinase [Bacteroidales bacterium]
MIKLKTKLALFNLLSKLAFTALFLIFMSYIIERINLRQVDNNLIQKREQVLDLIARIGIDPFLTSDSTDAFGSYNILKEEFISLERVNMEEDWNYIEVTSRLIEDEEIAYRVLNYSFMVDGQKYLLEIGNSLTSILYAKRNITKVILVFLVFIIIITLLTDLQYNHYLLRPLDKIIKKLKGISSPSLFDKTPVRTNTSDFFSLDHALREMMEHIDELFQKEKEITINISHELLTPVSVLRSKLENLLLKEDIDPAISEKIEESLKTLHRLQSLVNSLLFIARIESHQYLREETIEVNVVLQEILNEISPIAEDKGVILKEEYIQDLRFKAANRSLFFSMLYNVVNNAVKFTPTGGEVIVKSLFQHGRYIVTISDTGRGMTHSQKSTLFSRFKSKINIGENSTGIGLAITKSIADFHNIEISVTSEPEKGTTFSFLFA